VPSPNWNPLFSPARYSYRDLRKASALFGGMDFPWLYSRSFRVSFLVWMPHYSWFLPRAPNWGAVSLSFSMEQVLASKSLVSLSKAPSSLSNLRIRRRRVVWHEADIESYCSQQYLIIPAFADFSSYQRH
jgi:hypothetical protein